MRTNRLSRGAALSALTLSLLLVMPSVASATRTLGLSTGSYKFNVAAGRSGKGDVVVMNDGTEPIKVLVYTANQAVDNKGKAVYSTPDIDDPSSLDSPATWIRVQMPEQSKAVGNVPYLELKPKQRVPVRFSFVVPPNVPPGDHQVLLFFEMFEFSKANNGAVSRLSGRLGTRIKVRVQGNLVERLDVRPFAVPRIVFDNEVPYTFVLRNEGNIDKTMDVRIALLDRNEEEKLSSQVITDTPLYANTSLEAAGKTRASGLLGLYTLRLTAEYPKEGASGQAVPEQIVKDRAVWFVPLWLAGVLAVLLGLLILYVVWRLGASSGSRRSSRSERGRRDSDRRSERERRAGTAAAMPEEDEAVVVPLAAEAPAPASVADRPRRRQQELWSDDDLDIDLGKDQSSAAE